MLCRVVIAMGVIVGSSSGFRFPGEEAKSSSVTERIGLMKFPEQNDAIVFDQEEDSPPVFPQCGVSKYSGQRRPRDELLDVVLSDPDQSISRMMDLDKLDQRSKDRDSRIINGIESKPGAWPWQVSLQLRHPKWGFVGHWCGGVLIDPYWVLTAAHCIHNKGFSYPYGPMWTAIVGEHDRGTPEGTEQTLMVEKVILHERFREYHNDIALMKLVKPPIFNSTNQVSTICLPPEDAPAAFEGVRCIASGWGQSQYGGKLDQILHQAELPVVDNIYCKQVYGPAYSIGINPYHLCAGPITGGGVGTCVGDSGGPLQCSLHDGRWYLAGITSFGSGCAKPGFPDVFTRITYYLPWIRGKLRMYS